jgi:glycosyltransferase involved in cell wall biosynthesis
LYILAKRGLDFEVAILGENFKQQPVEFLQAQKVLGERIVHFGYANNFDTYADWLWQADLLPVTSNQDFFGISVMQAIYCNCYPILPKRLAYPELIPAEFHPNHFYNDLDDLVDRLDATLRNIKNIRQQSLQSVAAPYDWSHMAPVYDSHLEQIKNSRQN